MEQFIPAEKNAWFKIQEPWINDLEEYDILPYGECVAEVTRPPIECLDSSAADRRGVSRRHLTIFGLVPKNKPIINPHVSP